MKKMIFCLGVNELVEQKDRIAEALSERIDIFAENKDNVDVAVTYFPSDLSQWRRVDPELSEKLFAMVDGDALKIVPFETSKTDAIAAEYDAYYGSPSPLVSDFVMHKKPVMMADFGR